MRLIRALVTAAGQRALGQRVDLPRDAADPAVATLQAKLLQDLAGSAGPELRACA